MSYNDYEVSIDEAKYGDNLDRNIYGNNIGKVDLETSELYVVYAYTSYKKIKIIETQDADGDSNYGTSGEVDVSQAGFKFVEMQSGR